MGHPTKTEADPMHTDRPFLLLNEDNAGANPLTACPPCAHETDLDVVGRVGLIELFQPDLTVLDCALCAAQWDGFVWTAEDDDEQTAEREEAAKAAAIRLLLSMEDWKLVCECLHGSMFDHIIDPAIVWAAYCAGDGYGSCSPEELGEINGGWDWSHIRDSSDDAKTLVAAVLRRFLQTL